MASYRLDVSATAEKQIRKLGKVDQLRVLRAMASLVTDPRPAGSRKLSGLDDTYRVRVGVFRVIYSIEHRRLVIIVLKVGHRREIYRSEHI